jgi:hypothetical protein
MLFVVTEIHRNGVHRFTNLNAGLLVDNDWSSINFQINQAVPSPLSADYAFG